MILSKMIVIISITILSMNWLMGKKSKKKDIIKQRKLLKLQRVRWQTQKQICGVRRNIFSILNRKIPLQQILNRRKRILRKKKRFLRRNLVLLKKKKKNNTSKTTILIIRIYLTLSNNQCHILISTALILTVKF